MVGFSSLTTVDLLTDALVLLKVNEAKACGTSVYSYVKASWRMSLPVLGMRTIYNVVGWVQPAQVPPLSFQYVVIQQSGIL